MRTHKAALLIAVASLGITSMAGAQNRSFDKGPSFNMDHRGPITNCGDLRIEYGHRPAVTEEAQLTLPASQTARLRTQMSNGGVFITGWDRSEYLAKTCKAVSADDPNPTATLRDIVTTSDGSGLIAVSGPAGQDWVASLIIMVPRLTNMEVETRNGPLQLRDLAGNIRLAATNGPISLH